MNDSLANLTKYLGDDHPVTSKYVKSKGYIDEQIALVCRKGIYQYDYIDSYERFLETELPPFHEFYSQLKGVFHMRIMNMLRKYGRNLDTKI